MNARREFKPGDRKSGDCPFGANGEHEWAPDPEDPDAGDTCTLCGAER